MKCVLLLLAVLPFVLSAPEKRLVLDTILQFDKVGELVKQLFDVLGSDATEKECENQCHRIILVDHLLQNSCPLVCQSFHSLIVHFNLGHTTTPSA